MVNAPEDEFEARTMVEPSPAGRGTSAPEGVPEEIAGVDHSTRWLTPEPSAGPSTEPHLETVGSREPQSVSPSAELREPAGIEAYSPPQPDAFEPSVQVSPELMQQPEQPEHRVEYEYETEYDEEEDIPPDFVEPFSLLNNLIRENFAKPEVACEPVPVVEVIGYTPQEKQVMAYDQVNRGRRYRIGAEKFTLLKFDDQTSCTIQFTDEFSGGVISGGQKLPVDDLKTSNNLVKTSRGRKIYSYKLLKGDYGNLILGGQGWFVRFVNPPRLPPPKTSFQLNPFTLKVFGSSFLAHVIIIVLMSFFSKPVEAVNDQDIDRFAKVAMNEIKTEVEEPEAEVPLDQLPQPEEQKVEEEKPQKEQEKKPEKKVKPRKTRRRARNRGSGGGGKGGAGGGGGVGMMAALGNLNKNRPSTNIVAAVSNLDAVRVPGARSRFKVSGIVTKLPTSSVVLSRGRGVGVKTGIELLRGGKGRGGRAGIGPGALGGGKTGRRGIGGVVFKAPKRRMKVRGHLSREAIAKVVRAHLREIQYCYEKNLLLNPNLKGKVVMEWTIATSGSVTVVKTKQNTMAAPTVAMCIAAKIRRWKFPRPKGGIVIVKYPFIFNSIGF
ncbi:MAG: hypothetical protein D6806_18985 [Deltaproteobacteria bacterium]|nr:MAG: hypothetical protein D6806_18985 [Deltaproteobacteria bacterium]